MENMVGQDKSFIYSDSTSHTSSNNKNRYKKQGQKSAGNTKRKRSKIWSVKGYAFMFRTIQCSIRKR